MHARNTSRRAPCRRWAEGGQSNGGQARDQPDRLDQRRHAGARRRDAARDLPEGGGRGRLQGHRKGRQVPNDARPRSRPCSASTGWSWSRAGTAASCAPAASRKRSAMRPHFDLLKACGCPVLIFAETAGTVQGKQRAGGRPPGDGRGRVARLPRKDCPARRLDGRERRADGLPPSHGHGGREGGRDRPPDGRDARDGGPALRHRPPHLRRRGPGGGREGGPSGSIMSTPRTSGPR